uniref:Uncharacterized protein n=1 Tax=Aegilops tauschii subsp. strangulata TaxID=200361 RepID=A0A453ITI5_AEGTS
MHVVPLNPKGTDTLTDLKLGIGDQPDLSMAIGRVIRERMEMATRPKIHLDKGEFLFDLIKMRVEEEEDMSVGCRTWKPATGPGNIRYLPLSLTTKKGEKATLPKLPPPQG